ncbi:unnamed protein product, partial [Pylaiella littoralis]
MSHKPFQIIVWVPFSCLCVSVLAACLQEVSQDRLTSATFAKWAEIALMNGVPWEKLYFMVDAANQSNFATPLSASNAHGIDDKGYAERQKIYGVYVVGVSMDVFMAPQILTTGSNLVCTAIYEQFKELSEKWRKPLGDVVVQMDNTVSENKNNIIMGFCGALIARGVVRTMTLCFMMVGHTHIEIDQIFSRFSKGVKGRNVFSREHLGEVFEHSYRTVPVRSRTLENLGNFKGLVYGATRHVPGITGFQAFRISKEGPQIVVKVKRRMHHDTWLGFSPDGKTVGSGEGFAGWRILRTGAVRLEATPPFHLKDVDPEIIRQIEIRQRASWARLPASFPGDVQKQAETKDQQADSLRILRSTGEREFDLCTKWLPPEDDEHN